MDSFFDLTCFREVGQKYRNIFFHFLVQMKTSKSHSEINWPLTFLVFLHCASFASLSWMTEHCTTELRELSSPQIAYASWWSVTIPKSIRENCRNFTGNYSEMCSEFLRTIRRIFQTLAVKFNISWLVQMARESQL